MKFHIYRASNQNAKKALPDIDDAEEIEQFKSNPPHERAILEAGIESGYGWNVLYWSIEIDSIDDALTLYDSLLFHAKDYQINGLGTLIIADDYLD